MKEAADSIRSRLPLWSFSLGAFIPVILLWITSTAYKQFEGLGECIHLLGIYVQAIIGHSMLQDERGVKQTLHLKVGAFPEWVRQDRCKVVWHKVFRLSAASRCLKPTCCCISIKVDPFVRPRYHSTSWICDYLSFFFVSFHINGNELDYIASSTLRLDTSSWSGHCHLFTWILSTSATDFSSKGATAKGEETADQKQNHHEGFNKSF